MDVQPEIPLGPRAVNHRTVSGLCEQLRRLAPEVVSPVHLFDIQPQVMRGLFSVGWVTRGGALHRCVLSYRHADEIATERRLLAKLLLWGELDQTEGRIEIGANTGQLLRYFLPNAGSDEREASRHFDRSRADWESAGVRGDGPKRVWVASDEGGGKIGGISAAGVHYLVRLSSGGRNRLQTVCQRLGCAEVDETPENDPLFRDVMGEWDTG